jgi:hypothetical protein
VKLGLDIRVFDCNDLVILAINIGKPFIALMEKMLDAGFWVLVI